MSRTEMSGLRMINIQMKIGGDLQKRISSAVKKEPFAVKKAVKDSVILIWRESAKRSPKWRGRLRRATSYRVIDGLRGIVSNNLKYAEYVHNGQRPHKIPKYVWSDASSDFVKWAQEHGMSPFVLARSIKRKGTRRQPWMAETFKDCQSRITKIFDDAVDNILKGRYE